MRLFRNRWRVVTGSVIGLMVSGGPVNIFTFGVFLRAVTDDIHIGRGAFASAMLVTNWISAASGPFLGWLLDRYGARRVLLGGTILFAIATAMQAYITSSLLIIYLLFAFKGLMAAGQSPVSYAFAVSKWFDRDAAWHSAGAGHGNHSARGRLSHRELRLAVRLRWARPYRPSIWWFAGAVLYPRTGQAGAHGNA